MSASSEQFWIPQEVDQAHRALAEILPEVLTALGDLVSLPCLETYANLLLCSEQSCQNFLFTVRGGGSVINMSMEQNAVGMQKWPSFTL